MLRNVIRNLIILLTIICFVTIHSFQADSQHFYTPNVSAEEPSVAIGVTGLISQNTPSKSTVDNAQPQEQTLDEEAKPASSEKDSKQNGRTRDNGEEKKKFEPAEVNIDGTTLFTIQDTLGEVTPKQRATEIADKIRKVAEDDFINLESLKIITLEGFKLIQAEDVMIAAFSQKDAAAENKPLKSLADERLEQIKASIKNYRKTRTGGSLLLSALKAIVATAIAAIALFVLNRALPSLFKRVGLWQRQRVRSVGVQDLQFISSGQLAKILSISFKILRFFLVILVLYIYIPFLLSCFPWTKPIGIKILKSFWNALNLVWSGFIGYLPSIFIIGLIIVISYYSIRFSNIFFNAIKRGRIHFEGFYPEWATPTNKISNFLIIALAAVLIFPYLPASNSPGFQGISLFVGALFTLGSTSVVGNVVSGIVLIYTRAFQNGDMIKANGQLGRVLEKTMLSTRIMTPDNEIITIPNASLLASDIINYTAILRDKQEPLLLKTTITLGYDVPWRKVHEVLIEAALASEEILKEPKPFVLQTSLDDFYVSYTLKAFTKKPTHMGRIYSQLHQNIQDQCNESDIEILSPHYSAMRDGNQITIPVDYLPDDYQVPSFRISSTQTDDQAKQREAKRNLEP